jgi:hypothetical protein
VIARAFVQVFRLVGVLIREDGNNKRLSKGALHLMSARGDGDTPGERGGRIAKKKNGAVWLKRLPCSRFLERAIKMLFLDNLEVCPFRGTLGPKSPLLRPFTPFKRPSGFYHKRKLVGI